MSSPFVCFVHIEKCAGTSLHYMLHNAFRGYFSLGPDLRIGECFTQNQLKRLRALIPALSGIGGHRVRCYLDYEAVVIPRPVYYCTFLRDPVSRYLSHLNYQNIEMNRNWTLESFVKDKHYWNFQTFRVAGIRDVSVAKKLLLKKVGFVGLMEDYDRSLVLMSQFIGLRRADFRYEKVNVGKKGSDIVAFDDLSTKQRNLIVNANRLDLDLYEFAKIKLFPKYLENYEGDIDVDLEIFKKSLVGFSYSPISVFIRRSKNVLANVALRRVLNCSV